MRKCKKKEKTSFKIYSNLVVKINNEELNKFDSSHIQIK